MALRGVMMHPIHEIISKGCGFNETRQGSYHYDFSRKITNYVLKNK